MPDTDLPAWITEDAPAALYSTGRGRPDAATIQHVTVQRILKTYIMLSTGQKVRRADLHLIERRDAWTAPTILIARDDPRAQDVDRRDLARRAAAPLVAVLLDNKLHGNDPADLLRQVEAIRDAATQAHTSLLRILES